MSKNNSSIGFGLGLLAGVVGGIVAGVLLAYFGVSLFGVAVCSCAVVFILELFINFL